MKKLLIILTFIMTTLSIVSAQNGGACTYTLPGGTVVCYVSGHAGIQMAQLGKCSNKLLKINRESVVGSFFYSIFVGVKEI